MFTSKRLCLLGGSNSVMKFGLKLGLCGVNDICLSVGASSSLQNIHALIANRSTISDCDIIITESNVNDSYNIHYSGYSKSLVINNITLLYDELARMGKPVIVLILPVKL